ncbi:hypothetical protein ES703_79557 [subsurface metagenome]
MTIQEAIEILQADIYNPGSISHDELEEAEQLGVEALNFRLRWEQQEGEDDFTLLPGETKE